MPVDMSCNYSALDTKFNIAGNPWVVRVRAHPMLHLRTATVSLKSEMLGNEVQPEL